jgi:hypothetical protein
MSQARQPLFDPYLPFTRGAALAAGLADRMLRTTSYQRVFRSVFVSVEVPLTIEVRARAALLLHPRTAHASHSTAARIFGIPVPADPDVHVTVQDQRDRRAQPGLRAHVREGGSDRVLVQGIYVSAPGQIFIELAGSLPLVEVVIAGDAMARAGLISPADLIAYCDRRRGTRHSRPARRAASYVRAGVDSPMETRVRLLLVFAGLPEPKVNLVVRDDLGVAVRRGDLGYEAARMLVEYDGRHHIDRVAQWESDLARREEFDERGWRILVVTSSDIFRRPSETIRRVQRALVARGVPVGRTSNAWRRHFPER